MIAKTTITITPIPSDDAQVLTVAFYLPVDQRSLDNTNPRIMHLVEGIQDHLRHYDIQLDSLNDEQEPDIKGDHLALTLILAGAYQAPVILRVASEIIKVALLYGA